MAEFLDREHDKDTGITTTHALEDNALHVVKSWDATPHLEYAASARQQTAGKRWGEGRLMGHIPPAFYAQILIIRDKEKRAFAIKKFFADNPAFLMFDGGRK